MTGGPRASDDARYTVLQPIAAGGMGTVFLGQREGIGGFVRKVALKRTHAALATKASVQRRFFREAAAASMLHHANVVPVVDLFEREGETWLVLDWIDGLSLSQLLVDRGRLPTPVAVRVVLDACRGLAAAHELRVDDAPLGLQHRDVSPGNILVGRDGISRISDFGLSRTLETTITNTAERFLEGKLGYLAPELFQGKDFDVRCDLYAMGICLWEAAAGMRLFRAQSVTKLMSEQRARTSLATLYPDLAWLEATLERALAIDPDRRAATVRAFSDALERAAADAGMLGSTDDVARLMAELTPTLATDPIDAVSAPTPVASARAAFAALTPPTGPLTSTPSQSVDARAPVLAEEPSSLEAISAVLEPSSLEVVAAPSDLDVASRDAPPAPAPAPAPVSIALHGSPSISRARPSAPASSRSSRRLTLGAVALVLVGGASIALIAGRDGSADSGSGSPSAATGPAAPADRTPPTPPRPESGPSHQAATDASTAVIVLGPEDLVEPAASTTSSPTRPPPRPRSTADTQPLPKNPYRKRP
jgi:serine/threonine-protein kinase